MTEPATTTKLLGNLFDALDEMRRTEPGADRDAIAKVNATVKRTHKELARIKRLEKSRARR